ncbi:MAG: translesion DNA synthesis-associated protein ImuA [Thioalkalivibrionaceae bacterium]
MGLETLLDNGLLWRAREAHSHPTQSLNTGFSSWDRCLAGGWPAQQLIEGCGQSFQGELYLLMPALARIAANGRMIVLLAPPAAPWVPTWESLGIPADRLLVLDAKHPDDRVWSIEQLLRHRLAGAVVGWLPQVDGVGLRRLRLATAASDAWCWIFRPQVALERPSSAHLRFTWTRDISGFAARVLKQAGQVGDSPWVRIPLEHPEGSPTFRTDRTCETRVPPTPKGSDHGASQASLKTLQSLNETALATSIETRNPQSPICSQATKMPNVTAGSHPSWVAPSAAHLRPLPRFTP